MVRGMERNGTWTAKEKRRESTLPVQRSSGPRSGSSTRTHTQRSALQGNAMACDIPDSAAVKMDERSGSAR
eukprot:scaffold77696_cov72-Phaeocystis_antarctica.AAC.2